MAAIDLCGTADVWAYLQKGPTETAGTAVAADLITRASRAILTHCRREFVPGCFGTTPGTVVQAHDFWYLGGSQLRLAPFDLRSAGTVQIDTETSSPFTLVENQDYYLEPKPNPDGIYESFRFYEGFGSHQQRPRQVTITGSWGFHSVPEDVKDAAVKTTAIWLRRDVHAFSSTFNIDEARLERPEALPSSVKAGLAHYRRAGVQ